MNLDAAIINYSNSIFKEDIQLFLVVNIILLVIPVSYLKI
jgi:hypothetical protein